MAAGRPSNSTDYRLTYNLGTNGNILNRSKYAFHWYTVAQELFEDRGDPVYSIDFTIEFDMIILYFDNNEDLLVFKLKYSAEQLLDDLGAKRDEINWRKINDGK